MTNIPTVRLFVTRNAPHSFTATVRVRGEAITGSGRTRRTATKAVEGLLLERGIGIPNWAIVEQAPAPVARPEDFDDSEAPVNGPATERDSDPAPVSEEPAETTFYRPSHEEPKLPSIQDAIETGLVTPIADLDRYAAAYRYAKVAMGEAGEPGDIARLMKAGGFASPFDRDADGRPFHLYCTDEFVRAPRKGEGERRRLKNSNGFERDFQGRSPVEEGSLARETSPNHPANEPERKRRKTKVELTDAQKAGRAAYKLGSAASAANNGTQEQKREAYKLGYVAGLAAAGETSDPKFGKFLADLGLTEVPDSWLAWAMAAKVA